MDWNNATEYCESFGMSLAYFDSESEFNLYLRLSRIVTGSVQQRWIDGTSQGQASKDLGRRRFRENDVSEGRCFRETYISATLGNISIAETSFSRKHQSLKISHVISQKYKSEDQSSWKKMVRGRQNKIFKTHGKSSLTETPVSEKLRILYL